MVSMECCAITDKGDATLPTIDPDGLADSIFASMTTDQRIMQLYIYAPEQGRNYVLQSGPMPGGVMLQLSTMAAMKSQIDALGSWGDVPGMIAVNINRPIPGTPNYMNPYNVVASRHDTLVKRIVTTAIIDTLHSIGIDATSGCIADRYGLRQGKRHARHIIIIDNNDTTDISAFLLTPESSVKTALESDNELITGMIPPEMFLLRAQKALKDNPGLSSTIDYKALQILRTKCALAATSRKPSSKPSPNEAAAICALKSLSCVTNDGNVLPLPSGASTDIIQIGGFPLAGFGTQASIYGNYNFQYANATTDAITKALSHRHKDRWGIILLNAPIGDHEAIATISHAASDGMTCIINFDNPGNLALLDGKCIVQQVGNNAAAAQMAARAVYGTIDINGVFPYKSRGKAVRNEGRRVAANKLKFTLPMETEFNLCYKDTLDSIISQAIHEGCFPGCQVFAAKDGKILINKAYGHFTYDSLTRPVNTSDLYDLASLTKVTATTLTTMYLYDHKLMDTDKRLGNYLHYNDSVEMPIMDVTLKAILQHRSGIYAYPPIIRYVNNSIGWRRLGKTLGLEVDSIPLKELSEIAYKEIYSPVFHKDSATTRISDSLWLRDSYRDSLRKFYMRLSVKKRNKYQYSDVNMILLQWANEEVLKCRADSFLSKTFYQPLGMMRTFHTPLSHNIPADQIAPTEAQQWTGKMLQGDVHDPAAALLGGISGNAGLFSTAYNIGILFQMMIDGGQYGGRRFLEKKTIEKFTAKQPNTSRALGFDMVPSNFAATSAGARTFGHTGFTGTCAWADPDNKMVIVFLCNRVYPDANNKKINDFRVRRKVCQAIYDGCGIVGDTKK